MSSPLIKISEQSWSLSCLCCNCAQEVKDTLRMEIGPAFVEYNHRFTCPHCQTYNQILLTREMFDTAHVMILHDSAENPPSVNQDFGSDAGSLGYSPGDPPAFESMGGDWSSISPQPGSPPVESPPPFGMTPPVEPGAPAGGYRPGIPSFEAAAPAQTPRVSGPQNAPAIPTAPAKKKNLDDEALDADELGPASFDIPAAGKPGVAVQFTKTDFQEPASTGFLDRTINLGGREVPFKQLLPAIVIFLITFTITFYAASSVGRRSAPPAPAKKPAAATTPAPPATGAAPANPPVAPPAATAPTVPVVEAQMITIPGGEYTVGRGDGGEYERPPHKVALKPFQIDIREVTNEEYAKFMAATGHRAPKSWPGGHYKGIDRLPVTDIDWNDAVAYAEWASKRLPTEAEWEVAAGGKDHLLYPWGNEWANNRANTREMSIDGPEPAGTFPAGRSPFGLYDMAGNVWEWTASEPEPYPGSSAKIANAKDLRVIRGGAYNEAQKVATTSARNWIESSVTSPALGFRCAKDAQ